MYNGMYDREMPKLFVSLLIAVSISVNARLTQLLHPTRSYRNMLSRSATYLSTVTEESAAAKMKALQTCISKLDLECILWRLRTSFLPPATMNRGKKWAKQAQSVTPAARL